MPFTESFRNMSGWHGLSCRSPSKECMQPHRGQMRVEWKERMMGSWMHAQALIHGLSQEQRIRDSDCWSDHVWLVTFTSTYEKWARDRMSSTRASLWCARHGAADFICWILLFVCGSLPGACRHICSSCLNNLSVYWPASACRTHQTANGKCSTQPLAHALGLLHQVVTMFMRQDFLYGWPADHLMNALCFTVKDYQALCIASPSMIHRPWWTVCPGPSSACGCIYSWIMHSNLTVHVQKITREGWNRARHSFAIEENTRCASSNNPPTLS